MTKHPCPSLPSVACLYAAKMFLPPLSGLKDLQMWASDWTSLGMPKHTRYSTWCLRTREFVCLCVSSHTSTPKCLQCTREELAQERLTSAVLCVRHEIVDDHDRLPSMLVIPLSIPKNPTTSSVGKPVESRPLGRGGLQQAQPSWFP
jgi:hypothetical protein